MAPPLPPLRPARPRRLSAFEVHETRPQKSPSPSLRHIAGPRPRWPRCTCRYRSGVLLCAMLLVLSAATSSGNVMTDGGVHPGHPRHHKHHVHHTEYSSQLEKSLIEDSSRRPASSLSSLCSNCVFSEEQRSAGAKNSYALHKPHISSDSIRLEAIKHQILSKLGLKSKPNVTQALPREVVLETLYRAEESRGSSEDITGAGSGSGEYPTSARSAPLTDPPGEPDDFYGRTREIITFAEQGHTLNGQKLVEFSLPRDAERSPGQELRVKAAMLWVRVDFRTTLPRNVRQYVADRNLTLWVFRVNRSIHHHNATHLSGKVCRWHRRFEGASPNESLKCAALLQEFDEQAEMSASLSVHLSQLGWQKLDLTHTIERWYAENGETGRLRLLVDCSGCQDYVEVHLFHGREGQARHKPGRVDPDRPFLVVHTDPSVARRVRRRALDCSGALKGQCCKQRFYVSFQALGWDDWIIAPHGYFANYCRGDCGGLHRTPDTFLNYYTHVIEEYRKMDKLSGMQPCCAPLKFSSMSLIYFGPDSNIIKRDLPKMVVDECGCP